MQHFVISVLMNFFPGVTARPEPALELWDGDGAAHASPELGRGSSEGDDVRDAAGPGES